MTRPPICHYLFDVIALLEDDHAPALVPRGEVLSVLVKLDGRQEVRWD